MVSLQVDALTETISMEESAWRGLEKTYLMGTEFRLLADHHILLWEASAATIDAQLAQHTTTTTTPLPPFVITVVVKGLVEGNMIAVRYDHVPHWFEWCRVGKSKPRKRYMHLDLDLSVLDSSAVELSMAGNGGGDDGPAATDGTPLTKMITLQERSLGLLRELGVAVSIDPEEGIVFEGRKVVGAEEIARALLSSAVRKDDPTYLETVHHTLVHSRLLYLSRPHIAQILIQVLATIKKHPKIDDLICDQYTSMGEKAMLAMADVDAAGEKGEQGPLVSRWILQRSLCPHKQDLRDGTLPS